MQPNNHCQKLLSPKRLGLIIVGNGFDTLLCSISVIVLSNLHSVDVCFFFYVYFK